MKVMAALMLTLVLVFPLTPLAAETQRVGPVYRIGVLGIGSPPDSYVDGFRQGLREHGYIEGQNVVLEYRWAAGRLERLPELAAELVQLAVDIIFAGGGTAAVQAAQRATHTIPIVAPGVADPERSRPSGKRHRACFLDDRAGRKAITPSQGGHAADFTCGDIVESLAPVA